MKTVKCKSGLKGWQARLRENYTSFSDFKACAEIYGLHKRLGFNNPREAWDANPLVQGSAYPSDYRRVKEMIACEFCGGKVTRGKACTRCVKEIVGTLKAMAGRKERRDNGHQT